MTSILKKNAFAFAVVLAIIAGLYAPGLDGPWLLDDDANIGIFKQAKTDVLGTAHYLQIIFGNESGPLGRPIALASFALNHATGLFTTSSLKATNLLLHLSNGFLLYWLLLALLQRRNPLENLIAPSTLALILSAWWMILPIHVSSVFYIVQRMTLLSGFFSLAACIAYTLGRIKQENHATHGWLAITLGIFVFFPLAIFTKENSFTVLAWLLLIEIFFLQPKIIIQTSRIQHLLMALIALTACAIATASQLDFIQESYLSREFSLYERMMTQPAVLTAYMSDILLPSSSSMGIFHDDFPITRYTEIISTASLPMLLIAILLFLAVMTAHSSWWGVSFGILVYFSGHLIESTIIPLELYFEHRNYLPSIGLLVASLTVVTRIWPFRQLFLTGFLAIYMTTLGFSLYQRSHIWADKGLLLKTSALNHPQSMRAWTDYPEYLLEKRQPRAALEVALQAAHTNPNYAAVSYMQMISIYCRINQPAPARLINLTAKALSTNRNMSSSMTTPLSIGLNAILTDHNQGNCRQTDFRPLVPALLQFDSSLIDHYQEKRQELWLLRLTLAEWLLTLGHPQQALSILADIWLHGNRPATPTVGLVLAETLVSTGQYSKARQVLSELSAVTHDAPDDFRQNMNTLRQKATGTK